MKIRMKSKTVMFLAALTGLALIPVQSVGAVVMYHDFGEVTGASLTNISIHTTGAAGSTNNMNLSPVGLVDFSDGSPTGVSITVAGANGTDLRAGVLAAPSGSDPADALFNGVGLGFGTGLVYEGGNGGSGATSFTLTGLDPNLRYDIAFLGGRTVGADGIERFTLSGVDGTPTNLSSTGVTDAFTTDQETRDSPVPGEYVRWADIDPGADGTFVVTMDPEFSSNTNISYVSAMRLESSAIPSSPIPEPTTTALLGFGGLALMLRRRK